MAQLIDEIFGGRGGTLWNVFDTVHTILSGIPSQKTIATGGGVSPPKMMRACLPFGGGSAITSSTVAGVKARFWCSLSRLQAAYASASLGRNEAHGVISSCKIILDTSRFIVEPDSRR